MGVILCDRHAMFGSALATALGAWGLDVLESTIDVNALPGLVQRHRPALVVLDHDTAVDAGLEPTHAALGTHAEARLLVLAAVCSPGLWHALGSGLLDGLVAKSCETAVLIAAVRRVQAGERVVEGFTAPLTPVPMPRRAASALEPLTARERDVLDLMVRGRSTAEMAEELFLSMHTVRSHVQSVLRKLQVSHRTLAVRRALDLGIVETRRSRAAWAPRAGAI